MTQSIFQRTSFIEHNYFDIFCWLVEMYSAGFVFILRMLTNVILFVIDSYVVISAINDDGERLKKLKTKVKHGSLRPEYGEKLVFDIPDNLLPDVSLKIALKAKRLLKKNILLGSFVIKPDSEHWKKLLEDLWVTSSFSVFEKPKIDKV